MVEVIIYANNLQISNHKYRRRNIGGNHMTTNPLFNKTLLITGGTGSFGNATLNRFLGSGVKEIRIFSRDENKQDEKRN